MSDPMGFDHVFDGKVDYSSAKIEDQHEYIQQLLTADDYTENAAFNALYGNTVYLCNDYQHYKVEEITLIKVAKADLNILSNTLVYKDRKGLNYSRKLDSFLTKCFCSKAKAEQFRVNHIKFRLNQEVSKLGFSRYEDAIQLINDFENSNPEYSL